MQYYKNSNLEFWSLIYRYNAKPVQRIWWQWSEKWPELHI